jgi:hypothetical protein
MNTKLFRFVGGAALLILLVFAVILAHDNSLRKEEALRDPIFLYNYERSGYFKIDPKTILINLQHGDKNAFTPLSEDFKDVKEITDVTILWTQADILRIASALGQLVWNDPMDLKDWKVYYVDYEGDCGDPSGFNLTQITYFKPGGKGYITRIIEMHPYFGWVSWGDGATYSQPIIDKWEGVDLVGSKANADEALRISSKDAKSRFQYNGLCGVLMGTSRDNDPNEWHIKIFLGSLKYILYTVNLKTGAFSVANPNFYPTRAAP